MALSLNPPSAMPPAAGASTAPSLPSPNPFDLLHGHIDEVLGEFRQLARQDPWSMLSAGRLVDALPEILPKMLRLASRAAPHVDTELHHLIADQHGLGRRDDGIPLAAVADEWNHVRRACWKVLQRRTSEDRGVVEAMQRLDPLFDDAIGISLRGYYAPELDELRGRGLERRAGPTERRGASGDRRER